MDENHDGGSPTLAADAKHDREMSDYNEMRDRVVARVLHLDRYPRMAIERAVRILRAYFIDRRDRAPRRGRLEGLMLVGKNADRSAIIKWDREPLLFEIWAFVDHEAYKGKERYWGRAQAVLKSQLVRAIEVELSVFTIDEAARFSHTNPWLAERYAGGIVLFDRAMDPPRNAEAKRVHDRFMAAVATLDEPQRIAFQRYRAYGLDLGRISRPLRTSEAEARMILAEAFGTLLAEIDNEARPRSLRSHLGNHPRHNLDLYHRPGDFDLLLAVTFYRRAVDHVGMMVEAHARDLSSKIVQAAAYATEFALKALLLHAGYCDDWNRRHIGLDLEGALRHARANGLAPPSDELERLITPLSDYHRGGRRPDQARAVLMALPPAEIIETVATLVADVGTITGYTDLPGEELP
ncbi:DNA-directed RNA polymerase specialized sigma24 family protein OS=Sphingobium scionense OX=1404341 GN=GGQ90_001851 PE=4 SV=1 [Sphingobium scionense]